MFYFYFYSLCNSFIDDWLVKCHKLNNINLIKKIHYPQIHYNKYADCPNESTAVAVL